MGNFNINPLNTYTDSNISDFYNLLSLNFFAPCILQPTRLAKNSKNLSNTTTSYWNETFFQNWDNF